MRVLLNSTDVSDLLLDITIESDLNGSSLSSIFGSIETEHIYLEITGRYYGTVLIIDDSDYHVTECEYDEKSNRTKVKAMTDLRSLDDEFSLQEISPMSNETNDILEAALKEREVIKLPEKSFYISDLSDKYYDRRMDLFQDIAKITGTWISVRKTGNIIAYSFNTPETIDLFLDVIELEHGDLLEPIDTVDMTWEHGDNVSIGDGNSIIRLDGVELIKDDREELADEILSVYKGFTHRQLTARVPAKTNLRVGNYITLDGKEGKETILITKNKWDAKTFKSDLASEIIDVESVDTNYVGTYNKRISKTEIKVDKVNEKIEVEVSRNDDQDDKISGIQIDLEGIISQVENINVSSNLILNLAGTMNSYAYWEFDEIPSLISFPTLKQVEGLRISTSFEILEANTVSKFVKSFHNDNRAISTYGYIVPDGEYSYRVDRISGSLDLHVDILEYNKDFELIKTSTYEFRNERSHKLSFLPAQNTMYARVGLKIPHATPTNRVVLANDMFTRGTPKTWTESAGELELWTKAQIKQLDDRITSTVEEVVRIDDKLVENSSIIEQLSDEVILAVNQVDKLENDIHNTTVNITAENGVEIRNNNGKGLTIIGDNGEPVVELTSEGYLKAIDAEFVDALITGNLAAGNIAGLVFDDSKIMFPDGELELDSEANAIRFGRMEMKHSTFSILDSTTDVISIVTPTGKIEFISGIYYEGGSLPNMLVSDAISTNVISGKVGSGGVTIGGIEGSSPTYFTNSIINSYGGFTIGTPQKRWGELYLSKQPNVSSDYRIKDSIQDIPDDLVEYMMNLKPKQYVQDGEVHFGYVAQDVERELYKYCVDKYGWENAQVAMDKYAFIHKSDSYLSLLYNEIQVIKDAYYQRKIESLELELKKSKPRVSKGFRKRRSKQ